MTTTAPMLLSEMNLVDMLSSATRDLFDSMLGLDVPLSIQPEVETGGAFDGVLSLVGLTGQVIGTGALRCSGATACDLATRFLMTPYERVNDEVLDSVGEITNMIVGGFKTLLEGALGRLQMSVPNVIHGRDLTTTHPRADIGIAARCAYSGGEFRLAVGLSANPNNGDTAV